MTTLITANHLDDAIKLAPTLRSRAVEGEAARSMPTDIVGAVAAAGLFDLALPRSLGGLEADPITIFSVIEELSYADGSAGWTTLIGNSNSFLAWLEPTVARELLAPTQGPCAAVFAPSGTASPTGADSFTLDGRWAFASGCGHACIVQAGMVVHDEGRPRLRSDGRLDWRFAYVPASDVELVDTWHSLGLRGTGSHDICMSAVTVPDERTAMPFFDSPRHDGPLWRFPFVGLLSILMGGFPLGVARRAIDEVVALAPTKRRTNQPGTVAEDARFQVELARTEARVLAARALFVDATGTAWDTACNGDPVPEADTQRMQLAMREASEASVAAVDMAFSFAGGAVVYTGDTIQRCFRDIHTASHHVAYNPDGYKGWSQSRLGVAAPRPGEEVSSDCCPAAVDA